MIKLLIEHGAWVDVEDEEHYPHLIWAANNGCEDACVALLEAGANTEHRYGPDGSTALICAAEAGNLDVIRVLLEKGKVNIHARSNGKMTAFMKAAANGHEDVVNFLFAQGATSGAPKSDN